MDNSENIVLVAQSGRESQEKKNILSIIIPSYNHEIYIIQCLESINSVNLGSIELIIVDDCSKDSTIDLCKKFSFNERINYKIYSKQANKGVVDSLAEGLRLSTGEYISLIASDDKFDITGLEAAVNFLMKKPCDVLIYQAKHFGDLETYVYDKRMHDFIKKTPIERREEIWKYPPEPMLLQSCIFRAGILKTISPWGSDIKLDDWPLFINLFNYATIKNLHIVFKENITLVMYRMHSGGIHTNLFRQYELIKETYIKYVPLKYREPGLTRIALNIVVRLCLKRKLKSALQIAQEEKFFINKIYLTTKLLLVKIINKKWFKLN